MKFISILDDFTEYPGLRNCSISENSGEQFYHQILNPAFKQAYERKDSLTINLDGTGGYASSFLDEAFGNLVYDFTLNLVKKHIEIVSEEEPHWKKMLEEATFMQWEERRETGKRPIVTVKHPSWYRLIAGRLESSVWEEAAV
jgi:hypothetical protein